MSLTKLEKDFMVHMNRYLKSKTDESQQIMRKVEDIFMDIKNTLAKKIDRIKVRLSSKSHISKTENLIISLDVDRFYDFLKNKDNEDIKILFSKDITVEAYYRKQDFNEIKMGIKESKKGPIKKELPCFSDQNRLILKINDNYESWSKAYSTTGIGALQHIRNQNCNKSQYRSDFHPKMIRKLELQVIQYGCGYMLEKNPIQVFMCAKCDQIVGKKAKKDTCFLMIQLDRKARGKCKKKNGNGLRLQGYKTEIHGYPISEEEVHKYFSKEQYEKMLERVIKIKP